jgi:hypothetical protein
VALWAAVEGRFTGMWRFEDFIRVVYGAEEPMMAIRRSPGRICGLWTRGGRKRCFAVFRPNSVRHTLIARICDPEVAVWSSAAPQHRSGHE